MSTFLSYLAVGLWVLWLLRDDLRERDGVSSSTWVALVWVAIYASRPVTSWFSEDWDSPLIAAYDQGNVAEALVNIVLIGAGGILLLRRRLRLSDVIKQNRWFAVVYLFWLLSVVWSDYPLITLKRFVRDLGNIVMALVLLTEMQPVHAVRAVLARCVYICIPLSILLIRYHPSVGRAYVGYDRSELMYVGVATHKNTLGALALVGALFLLRELLDELRVRPRTAAVRARVASHALVLLMCWYLLVSVDSATSLVCSLLGSLLLVAFRIPAVRRNPGRFQIYAVATSLVLVLADSLLNLKEWLVLTLGRNMTLTTRTDVWPMLLRYQDNPLLGAGFNTFWAGDRLILSRESMGGIIQAHNGYLETYLNGGLIGVAFLVGLVLASYDRIRTALARGASDGPIRFVLLLVVALHNLSEASFYKQSLLWFVMVVVILEYRARRSRATIPAKALASALAARRP